MSQTAEVVQKRRASDAWNWALGLFYIFAVATIWIAASYIVQSVVGAGVSPFLVTYICNSLFIVYIPLVEIARYFEDRVGSSWFISNAAGDPNFRKLEDSENANLLKENELASTDVITVCQLEEDSLQTSPSEEKSVPNEFVDNQLDIKGRWTRTRVAKVSLLICPFWFFAQLTFNLSLKYTTVTSNTILSSASSLFTFLVALAFLGEIFTWVKLISVLLCMGGTIIVSLSDSETGVNSVARKPLLGDFLSLLSAFMYSIYVTLIRLKLPDEKKGEGQASMAQFLGFLGLFNFLIFLPAALVLNFIGLEPFHVLKWKQVGLIVGKGLLDNVLSDYIWAKAILLTTTTVATAGLTIQVPLAAIVDTLTGHAPHLFDYIGAFAVMLGFAGINLPSDDCFGLHNRRRQEEVEEIVKMNEVDVNLRSLPQELPS